MRKALAGKNLNCSYVKLFLFILFAVTFLKGNCSDSTKLINNRNVLFVEFSGKTKPYSINYEHIFSQSGKLNFAYSLGFASLKTEFGMDFSIPVSLMAITKGKQHHLEGSIEFSPYFKKQIYQNKDKEHHTDKQLYITPAIGYRYQKNTGRIFVKAGIGYPVFIDPPRYNIFDCTPQLTRLRTQFSVGIAF